MQNQEKALASLAVGTHMCTHAGTRKSSRSESVSEERERARVRKRERERPTTARPQESGGEPVKYSPSRASRRRRLLAQSPCRPPSGTHAGGEDERTQHDSRLRQRRNVAEVSRASASPATGWEHIQGASHLRAGEILWFTTDHAPEGRWRAIPAQRANSELRCYRHPRLTRRLRSLAALRGRRPDTAVRPRPCAPAAALART